MDNRYYNLPDGSYFRFSWGKLERDSEENCKARFRKLINDNSFLNGGWHSSVG